MNRTATCSVLGILLILFGVLAGSGTDLGLVLLIAPATPLAFISRVIDPAARHGMLWDTAHSPPFLNRLGLTTIYFLPGALLLLYAVARGVSRSRDDDK